MQREILNPRWDNDNKTVIITTFRYTKSDGTVTEVKASVTNAEQPDGSPNPDWVEIMDTFGVEKIDQITQERLDHIAELDARRSEDVKRAKLRRKQEQMFDHKLFTFEKHEIQSIQDVDSKRKIRQASDIYELQIAISNALIKDAFDRAGLEWVPFPEPVVKAPVVETSNTDTSST